MNIHISTTAKLIVIDISTVLFILLFIYTAANKIWKFSNFDWVLSTLPGIGSYHTPIAYSVPVAELITSVLLIFNPTKRIGLFLSMLLMLVFSSYLLFMLQYSKELPCNCGGVLSQLSWKQHIIFNLCFLLLALISLCFAAQLKQQIE
jgi:putative oxidoreductase